MAILTYDGVVVNILHATNAGMLVDFGDPVQQGNSNPNGDNGPWAVCLSYYHPGYSGMLALLLDSARNRKPCKIEVSDEKPPAHGAIVATIESVWSRFPV